MGQLVGFLSYIEAHFGIMRRLADFYLNKAPTLDEMKKAHRKFIRDYNTQIHGCRTANVRTGGTAPRMCYVVS
jgi:hypothetical protein